MNKSEALGTEKISRLLFTLSAPATMGMLAMSLYNVVDTIFVGRGVGTLAIAGISIVMPIQMLIFSSAQTIGIGAASIISRSLGSGDKLRADQSLGNLIILTGLLNICLLLAGYGFAESILFVFGAQGDIMAPARDYYLIILAGTPFLNYSMVFNNVNRAEGNTKVAMWTMMIAAVLNIIFDPIFIFGLDMGIKGAAIASVLAQFLTFLYLVYYFSSGRSVLRFGLRFLVPKADIIRETLAIGVSSLARHGAGSILAAILNHSLFIYGGEVSVAVYGVINRVLRISFMPLFGLVQGFLPISGYNYGAGFYQRVYEVFKKATFSATIIISLIFAALMLFARQIIAIFSTDIQLIEQGTYALRIIILAVPVIGFQVIGAGYFQALGKALPSFFLALSRQILFLIPLVLTAPKFFGLDGIWYSFPVADLLASAVTFFMLYPEIRRLRQKSDPPAGQAGSTR